jgi:hypothetical protein
MFLSTLLINVFVFVQLNVAVESLGNRAWRYRNVKNHEEVGKQIKGIL